MNIDVNTHKAGARHTFLSFAVFLSFFALALTGGIKSSYALLILDDMVFVGQNGSAATFKVKNTGDTPLAYRIEWTQMRMNPGGGKSKVERDEAIPGVKPAEPFMFLAPRRLILQPGQLQHIRFMVRRMENLEPGEYRSYIMLQPEAIPNEYAQAASQTLSAKGMAAAQVNVLTGYRIPVFFLHGETAMNPEVGGVRLGVNQAGKNGVFFTFVRNGTRSAIGDVTARCTGGEKETSVGSISIKLFTEIDTRDYFLPFNVPSSGCRSVALDYMPHKLDPDYGAQPYRLAEIPLQ